MGAYGHMLKNSDSGLNWMKWRFYIRGLKITKRNLKYKSEKKDVFFFYIVFSFFQMSNAVVGLQCSSNSSSACISNVFLMDYLKVVVTFLNKMCMCEVSYATIQRQ